MTANKPITIGDVTVKPGQRVNVNLPIANLYTSTSLHMPVKVLCGRRAGPVMFVSAAIHGDELNGVEIIRRLLKRKALRSLRGTLIAIPIVNIHGFIDQSRYLPDRRDLNRSFPGSPKGSIAARLAHNFLNEIVLKSEYRHRSSYRRHRPFKPATNQGKPGRARYQRTGRSFRAPVVVNASLRDGSLRACAAGHNIPVLIYEAGEALRFDELSIRAGIRGILNVMRKLNMLPALKNRLPGHAVIARSTSWVRASTSGIVTAAVALGTRVKKDDRLALISDPLGDPGRRNLCPVRRHRHWLQ